MNFEHPAKVIHERSTFGPREVGVSHPDNPAYIKVCDGSRIEAFAGPGVGIIIDLATRSVNIYADKINLHTKQTDGLRWNRLSLNHKATRYTEPAFIQFDLNDILDVFRGVDDFLTEE